MSRYCYDCCKFVTYTEDAYGNTVCPICGRIIESTAKGITAALDPIIQILINKRDQARYIDRYFNERDYTWIVGIGIYRILKDNLSSYSTYSLDSDKSDDGVYLMGIRLMVDVVDPHRISLTKEVH